MSFGGQKVRAHSLIGTDFKCEKNITYGKLKCKEKIALKLELGNCVKTKVFLTYSNYFENLNV